MLACGLSDGHRSGFDLCDQLTFVIGFELSTNLSHFEYSAPQPSAKNVGREGLLKMTHRWKSAKKRGFPHDAWKSVAQNSDAFPHFQQPRRRVSFRRDFIRVVRYAERLVLTGGKN